MNIRYFFSSPQGNIPLEPSQLAQPFRITPTREHHSLTLGDYFEAVEGFLLSDKRERLVRLLEKELSRAITSRHISGIKLFSEKHGALYHVTRAEIEMGSISFSFAVIAAISSGARELMHCEYNVFKSLQSTFDLDCMPEVFCLGEVTQQTKGGHVDLSFLLAQWLEDYHEWHLTRDELGAPLRVCIWDRRRGHRPASAQEYYEIFRQASRILTLFYDPETYSQISPWHHAAGDFVVRSRGDAVDVKLTTARGYGPVMAFPEAGKPDPFIALTYFLLNLCVRMRLDKLDGIGETVWAEGSVLKACIDGFFQALAWMQLQGRDIPGPVDDISALLGSFEREEFLRLYQPLLLFYEEEEPEGYPLIRRHLGMHVRDLHRAIQRFRTGDHPGGC